ncbi:MAG: hypothetical protein Q9213_005182 [Squamulea squamosa]
MAGSKALTMLIPSVDQTPLLRKVLPSSDLRLDVLDLERERACTSPIDPNNTVPDATAVKPRVSQTKDNTITTRSSTCICRWIHVQPEELDFQQFHTIALEIAFKEYKNDPSSTDKLRNISRVLTRFRQKRESKGVHGRSFQAAFSRFREVGRKDELSNAREPQSSTSHLPKTLLQHHYRFDEYALHSEEPLVSIKPTRHIPGFKARPLTVLVDELWGLCLDEPSPYCE